MTSKIDLAACPFCGRTAPLKFWDSRAAHEDCDGPHTDGSNDTTWAVVCDATNYGCGASAGFKPTQEAAAAMWNARGTHETGTEPASGAAKFLEYSNDRRLAELEKALRNVRDHGCCECFECCVAINRLLGSQ